MLTSRAWSNRLLLTTAFAALLVTGCTSGQPLIVAPQQATNGTDVDACREGTCEITVKAGTSIALDDRLGVKSMTIDAITGNTITIDTTYFDGGLGSITFSVGSNAVQNKISFVLVAIHGSQAVLRLTAT